jgi:integrase
MAHLTRIHQVRYVDRDGRRVPKGTRGARKVKEKSAKWYGAGIPGQGKRRVPLATDKEAAQRMLDNLVRDAERGTVRLPERNAGRKPLAEYFTDFESDVALGLASKGGKRRRTPDAQQVALVVQRVRDLAAGCSFECPGDLDVTAPATLARYLAGRLAKPRTKVDRGISHQSANFYLAAARRFVRWLSARAAVRADLFDTLPGYDAANERTHARREVSPEELDRVLTAARASTRTVRNLTGEDRYHLYLTAFATGFRASELAALTPAHFHLADDPPAVSLAGKTAKNKKSVRHPLPPAVAVALRAYLAGKPASAAIWPGKWTIHAAKMLRVDLAAAKVPYCVEGPGGKEFADFHALRHTFVSALAAAGTGAKELQTLARHSDPRLTLGLYTHARSAELVRAVNRLKVPGTATHNPLAQLDRDTLEGIVLGLVVLLGTLLGSSGHSAVQSSVALPVAPAVGISGDLGEPVGTRKRGRKVAG